MKLPVTILLLIFTIGNVQSQVSSSSMKAEFKELSRLGSRQMGTSLQPYSAGTANGNQFFTDTWTAGSVITTGNDSISKGYLFLFDKVRHELFMKSTNGSSIFSIDKTRVRSFTIQASIAHFFEPAIKYDASKSGKFIEVLFNDPVGISLLKFIQTDFIKPDLSDMVRVKNGDMEDKFLDNTTYYFYFNNKISPKISLNQNNIEKRLELFKTKVTDYFKNNPADNIDEKILLELVKFLHYKT